LIAYLLQGLTLGVSAAVSPGPFQAYLLSQALKSGWRRAVRLALAPLVSDGPIVVLILLLLKQTPGWFLRALHFAGGLFLLYLAKGAYDTFKSFSGSTPAADPARGSFFKGVTMNALSPGPYIFWSVLAGPILLKGWAESPSHGLSFAFGFYLTLIGGLAGLIILFATASRLGPKVARALNGFSALALLLFGLYQIWQGIVGA
jgi:threonine/homoserine/homoserine lactone efflux protein